MDNDRHERARSRNLGNLRQLEQFLTVAETRNFTRAAERLHIAQPALSLSIQKLEQELGAALFVREPRGVRLTRVGEAALVEARLTLAHAAQFAQVAQAAAEGIAGRLRLGFVASSMLGLLQQLITNFAARYPKVELDLVEGNSSGAVVRLLEDGKIDIGIVRTPLLDAPGMQMLELQDDLLVAAVPAGHPLAGARSIGLSDLRDERFIMYRSEGARTLRSAVMLACQQAGYLPRISHEVSHIATVLTFVEARLGVGLVPSLMAPTVREGVSLVPIRGAATALHTGLSLIWKTGEEAATSLFRSEAVTALQRRAADRA